MRKAPTLLVTSPSTGGYYFGALLAGVAREAAARSAHVVVVQTLELGQHSDEIGEAPDFRLPVAWDQADALVSVTSSVDTRYLREAQEHGLAVTSMSTVHDGLDAPSALPDNHGGTAAVVRHLLEHGHREVGFVGNLAQLDVRERHAAYRQTLAEADVPVHEALSFDATDNGEDGGFAVAGALVAADPRPTAVMVATDRNATGLIAALEDHGLRVPEDVAVVSFDNVEGAPYTSPPLTTVDQPFDEVGALATDLALRLAAGEQVPAVRHTAPATPVVRASCGCTTEGRAARPTECDTISRAATVQRLSRVLSTGDEDHDAALPEAVSALLTTAEDLAVPGADPSAVADLVEDVHGLTEHVDALRDLATSLIEHLAVHEPRADESLVGTALRELQAEAFLARAAAIERRLDEQFGLDAALLDSVGTDPRALTWLGGTDVRAAALALWEDGSHGALDVVGVHDPAGRLGGLQDTRVRTAQFPPRALVELADPARRELCFVVPVRTRDTHWGLLAVVAEIDTASARETYHHWASLLAATLDQSALQRAVHLSEERYALAARAANDGLWEVELAQDRVHVSARGLELLGLDSPPVGLDELLGLSHPEDVSRVRDATSTAMAVRGAPVEVEFRVRRGDGSYRWVMSRFLGEGPERAPVRRLVGSLSDVHTRKELEEQLREGALFDPVTGLPNRRLFLDRLRQSVTRRTRRPGAPFAVLFLDLDGFKLVNDSLGHLMGDELLREVGRRLGTVLRSTDTAARFGGDEFAILLADPAPEEVLRVAERVQQCVAEPIRLGEHEVSVTTSIGITTADVGYIAAEDVLRDADTAMYHAKARERGSASVFDPAMHTRASGRLRLHGELRAALSEHQFVVHYQPIVPLDGSGLTQLEALVRWQHPTRGLLMPGEFLPDMLETAQVVELGRWLVDEVCRQIAQWRTEHPGDVTVAVNVSHREFWAPDLLETVTGALARHGVPSTALVLEITETVIMGDMSAALEVMAGLRGAGLRLHIDDFGTGHSSLNALRTLPVDALKIDGSFIRELTTGERSADLVEVILYLGKVLGLEVIAECVETPAQAEQLLTMGCSNAQGWLYAKALSPERAGALLGQPLALAPGRRAQRRTRVLAGPGPAGTTG